jgi:molybdenum cofactor cytidylyltransferase
MTERPRNYLLGALLLAAGPSSRLGQPKQLVQFHGDCLVRRSAGLLLKLGLDPVIVVTGFEHEAVEHELRDLSVRTVLNRSWSSGMGGSIAFGCGYFPRGMDGVLLMVCDQWRLELADLRSLVAEWKTDTSGIVVANWQEGRAFVSGPPVIFPGRLIPEMKFLDKGRGARQVIDRHMDEVTFVTIQNAAHDLDRPENLEQLQQDAADPQ